MAVEMKLTVVRFVAPARTFCVVCHWPPVKAVPGVRLGPTVSVPGGNSSCTVLLSAIALAKPSVQSFKTRPVIGDMRCSCHCGRHCHSRLELGTGNALPSRVQNELASNVQS